MTSFGVGYGMRGDGEVSVMLPPTHTYHLYLIGGFD
jgi:hypothetical protein